MVLSQHEEKVLITIQRLGPDHICNRLFQDAKSQAALARLIRHGLIKPDFTAKDEMVEQLMDSGVINREDFDLHFRLTGLGREYADHVYIPNPLFGGRMFLIAVLLMLAVMAAVALWLM